MRTLILCLFCGALAAQNVPVKTDPLCSVEGKVVSAAGEPLADVKLKLQPVAPAGPAGFPATRVSFVTLSDDSGQFAFAGIEPGAYTFSAELSGYLKAFHGARRSSPSGAPLSLAPGERKTGIEFRLQQQGVVAGRVVRPGGITDGFLQVVAARLMYANGKKQLKNFATSIVNNDEGRFRLSGLEPGRYYIVASSPFGGGATQYLSGSAPDPVQTTFYPSSPDVGGARVFDVAAGATVSGVEIVAIQGPAFAVRGRVVNRSGQDLRDFTVSRRPASGMSGEAPLTMILRSGTQFDLGTVPGGRVLLAVEGINPEGRFIASRHVIDVEGTLDGLELAVNPPFPVQGRLSVEDGAIPPGIKVSAATQDAQSEVRLGRNADVGADGGFTLPDVNADRYTVSVTGMPDGYYVKSIRLGKANVLEDDLDITQQPEQPLEVVLSAKAATIRGAVTGAGAGVTVALVPQGEKRRSRPEFYRTALTDRSGRFTLPNLPPGEYKVFAWEDVENGAWMDPDFLKPLEEQGTPVRLGEGAEADVELKAIP
jgi:hypothetical protein